MNSRDIGSPSLTMYAISIGARICWIPMQATTVKNSWFGHVRLGSAPTGHVEHCSLRNTATKTLWIVSLIRFCSQDRQSFNCEIIISGCLSFPKPVCSVSMRVRHPHRMTCHVNPVASTKCSLAGAFVLKAQFLVELDKLAMGKQNNPVASLHISHSLDESLQQSRTKSSVMERWKHCQTVNSDGTTLLSVSSVARQSTRSLPITRDFHVLVHDSSVGCLGHNTVSKEDRLACWGSAVHMMGTGSRLNRCKRV
jgi:hypothetical protein